jgi:lipoprotein-releasing system permease protein
MNKKGSFYIAKKIIFSGGHKTNVTSPVINIVIFAIALGIFMMIVAYGAGFGLQKKIKEKLGVFNGHIVVTNFDNNLSDVSKTPVSKTKIIKSIDSLNIKNEISSYQSTAAKAGIIKTDQTFEGVIFKGVDKDFNAKLFKDLITIGENLKITDSMSNEVIISSHLANRLLLKKGDKFTTYFFREESELPFRRQFKILGIYETQIQEFDKTFVLGDIKHIQQMNKWAPDQIGTLEVFLHDIEKMDAVNKLLFQQLPPDLDTNPLHHKFQHIFEWIKIFDFNVLLIIVIMTLVSIVNLSVATLILILEKTAFIGIIRTLGATIQFARQVFFYKALYITILGLFFGNLAAFILIFIQNTWGVISLNPENYYVSKVVFSINFLDVLLINLLVLLAISLSVFLPTYMISKIKLVDAIKFN